MFRGEDLFFSQHSTCILSIHLSLDNDYGTTCKAKLPWERQFPLKTLLNIAKRCYK
jgi:hypothetical protein